MGQDDTQGNQAYNCRKRKDEIELEIVDQKDDTKTWRQPYTPDTKVKSVTVLEVDGLGVDGGFRKPNLDLDSMIFRSVSSVGLSWYLDCKT